MNNKKYAENTNETHFHIPRAQRLFLFDVIHAIICSMEASFALTNLLGTIAFIAGVICIVIELRRRGLSRFSLVAYFCLIASTVFLSQTLLSLLLSIIILTALFYFLWLFYRKARKNGERK